MSSAQEHPLSHLRKIPSATSGSNKGVKIVPKALSGAIARHSGDGKFYAMPHNEALVGANFWHQFRAVRESDPAQVLGRVGYCGLMGPNGKIF